MNTPAHLIFGLAAFGRANDPKTSIAALTGAMLPDSSLYLLAGTHIYLLGTPAEIVFSELYFSSTWQSIFRIDNSIVLWTLGLVFAIWARRAWAVALCGAALLHLGLDFALHHDDGRAHFWPISTWIFQSPVSYWDPNHHGRLVGLLEILTSLGLCVWLWRRYTHAIWRGVIVALGALECLPVIVFTLMFSGG